jgi:hypothetical protein
VAVRWSAGLGLRLSSSERLGDVVVLGCDHEAKNAERGIDGVNCAANTGKIMDALRSLRRVARINGNANINGMTNQVAISNAEANASRAAAHDSYATSPEAALNLVGHLVGAVGEEGQ